MNKTLTRLAAALFLAAGFTSAFAQGALSDLAKGGADLRTARATLMDAGQRLLITDVVLRDKGVADVTYAWNSNTGQWVLNSVQPKKGPGQTCTFDDGGRYSEAVVRVTLSYGPQERTITGEVATLKPEGSRFLREGIVLHQGGKSLTVGVDAARLAVDQALFRTSAAAGNRGVDVAGQITLPPGGRVPFEIVNLPGWFDVAAPVTGISYGRGGEPPSLRTLVCNR